MNPQKYKSHMWRSSAFLAALFLTAGLAGAQLQRKILVITSTNSPTGNALEVFQLNGSATNSLSLADTLPTGGNGGASGNAGIVQFKGDFGVVANFGSNSVSQLVRYDNFIRVGRLLSLGSTCAQPDSVALTDDQLFVVGANCAQSYAWPLGYMDGSPVSLSDSSAAQIAVGETWAAVTMKSGSVMQLPLTHEGGPLAGTSTSIALPADANNTPLGEAFWGNLLGFTPAHSPDSFAIVNDNRDVFPVVGPTPPYPTNAPCWLAKGPKSVWYAGNSPGEAVSIFFSDAQGGEFYKSIPLPGVATDITVSADKKWLAVIYSGADGAHVAVFAIDSYGDLTPFATSPAIGVASFSGVAISE